MPQQINKSTQSKALARNTLYLYFRMMFSMLVSLYTSRVILQYLGAEDYGIYNVVGGVVSMFSLISGTLTTSVSRNLTYSLGEGNMDRLKKVFSMSINVQIGLIVLIIILAETIGTWFLNNKMIIPAERIAAANWILQFSVATFSFNLFSVPYNASLISHEKMSAFAYIGIIEIVLKLLVVYMLVLSPLDKLITYGFLLLLVSIIIQSIYLTYCKKHFEECTYQLFYDKIILNNILGFAGWNFIGSTASIMKNQGLSIMLNLFFGPTVNAARAIATQVNSATNGFVTNFLTALTPQITKAYAIRDLEYVVKCIYKGSKFSFFLLFFLSTPVVIEAEGILKLWLVNVPETTVNFVRYIIIYSLADTLSRTSINANNATGDIKEYQIVMGLFNLMILPCAYVALKLGIDAASTELISVTFMLLSLFPRIHFVKKHIPIDYLTFIRQVIIPVSLVSVLTYIPSCLIHAYLPYGYGYMVISIICTLLISGLIIVSVGLSKSERAFIFNTVKAKIIKK